MLNLAILAFDTHSVTLLRLMRPFQNNFSFQPCILALQGIRETQLPSQLRSPQRPLQRLYQLPVPQQGARGREGVAKEPHGAEFGPARGDVQQHDQGLRALRGLGDRLLPRGRDGDEWSAHHGGHVPPSAARLHIGQGVRLQTRHPRVEKAPRDEEGQAQSDHHEPAAEGNSRLSRMM